MSILANHFSFYIVLVFQSIFILVFIQFRCNHSYYAPAQGALSNDAVWHLSIWRLTSLMYVQSAGGVCGRPAGWHISDRAQLKAATARFRCRPGRGAYRGSRLPTTCFYFI